MSPEAARKLEICPEGAEVICFDDALLSVMPRGSHAHLQMLNLDALPRKTAYACCKRVFDIVASLVALVACAVPMAVIALAVRKDSPGPAIYKQVRYGQWGKRIVIYKFRTMRVDAEVRGIQWAADDDPRVTKVGRKLRDSRMDELPQFFNVLKGDMSLVGPRPERPALSDEFARHIDGWNQRLVVPQGLSGYAQVEGGYDLSPAQKAACDIEYIRRRSLLLDLKIMFKTIAVVFTGSGAR